MVPFAIESAINKSALAWTCANAFSGLPLNRAFLCSKCISKVRHTFSEWQSMAYANSFRIFYAPRTIDSAIALCNQYAAIAQEAMQTRPKYGKGVLYCCKRDGRSLNFNPHKCNKKFAADVLPALVALRRNQCDGTACLTLHGDLLSALN